MKTYDSKDWEAVTLVVMDILGRWRVNGAQQVALLGLPEKTRPRELTRYKHGTPFPQDNPVLREHVEHIMGIQESLGTIYPLTPTMPWFWIKTRNRYFRGASPLQVMLDEGLAGMHRVWCHLDVSQNWD